MVKNSLWHWARILFILPFLKDFLRDLREARAVPRLDSSFLRGALPVEDSKVRRTDDNLAPTIVKRFPSRTKVQAFTAEETLLMVAPVVATDYFFHMK